jgi:hypothetical protein
MGHRICCELIDSALPYTRKEVLRASHCPGSRGFEGPRLFGATGRMLSRHHRNDSLGRFETEGERVRQLIAKWQQYGLPSEQTKEVTVAYERGTIAKLLLEHAAIRLAAERDIEQALRRRGEVELADRIDADAAGTSQVLDALDETMRGVQPVVVGSSSVVGSYVEQLAERMDFDERSAVTTLLTAADRPHAGLHSDRFVRRHAPTHPVSDTHSFARLRPLLWLRARYDRLRGYPWAEDTPYADPKIDKRYGVEK